MHILYSQKLANNIKESIKQMMNTHHIKPGLATVLVGDDPASHIYVQSKLKSCKEIGFHSEAFYKDENCSTEELTTLVSELNQNPLIHGILVQLPLPDHIDTQTVINSIDPKKDIDCFHPLNLGRLFAGQSSFAPCTPTGIISILESIPNFSIQGKHALVIGRSNLVGKPISTMLLAKNATVTVTHSHTKNLMSHTKEADIIIVAVGKKHLLTSNMIKKNSVIIDVGIHRYYDPEIGLHRITGDVDFNSIKGKAYAVSPVPGGVGPMTITSLLSNTMSLALAYGQTNR